jgi:hypothetical protein
MLAVTTANCFGISLSRFDLLLLGDVCLVTHHLLSDCLGDSAHFDDLADWVVLGKDQVEVVLDLQLPMVALQWYHVLDWWVNVHFDVFLDGPENQCEFTRAVHVLVDDRSLAQGYHEGSVKIELQEVPVVTMREDRALASPGG